MQRKANNDLPPAVVICGPTGIGKTSFAIALARHFNAEIIGADSMQLYRRMDIGTAKPTAEEQAAVRHHMVDVVEPDAPFDAQMYAAMAYEIAVNLSGRGVLPLVVGGTGLYVKALIHGLFETAAVDRSVRRRLKEEAREKGGHYLYRRLMACDPAAARRIHANDTYRVVRALEVFETTARPLSERQESHRFRERRLDTLKIGLTKARGDLYERIDRRVDIMIEAGLLDEVRSLVAQGYPAELKSMQSLGYRHMTAFLAGAGDWEETVRTLKRDTRRYAKRQMTWFRADPEIVWLEPEEFETAVSLIDDFLRGMKKS